LRSSGAPIHGVDVGLLAVRIVHRGSGIEDRAGAAFELPYDEVAQAGQRRDPVRMSEVEEELLIDAGVREAQDETLGDRDRVLEEILIEPVLKPIVEAAEAAADDRLAIAGRIPGEAQARSVVVVVLGDVFLVIAQAETERQPSEPIQLLSVSASSRAEARVATELPALMI
jgi:hypothetical protein